MFGGTLSPPGFEPSSTKHKRCAVPIVLRRDAFFALLLCSADLFCSLSLSPTSTLAVTHENSTNRRVEVHT